MQYQRRASREPSERIIISKDRENPDDPVTELPVSEHPVTDSRRPVEYVWTIEGIKQGLDAALLLRHVHVPATTSGRAQR